MNESVNQFLIKNIADSMQSFEAYWNERPELDVSEGLYEAAEKLRFRWGFSRNFFANPNRLWLEQPHKKQVLQICLFVEPNERSLKQKLIEYANFAGATIDCDHRNFDSNADALLTDMATQVKWVRAGKRPFLWYVHWSAVLHQKPYCIKSMPEK